MQLLCRKPERFQLWKQTYPSGKVAELLYYDDGQLHQVKFDGSLVDTQLYDDGGRLENSTYGNGVETGFTYRNDNLVATITVNDPSQTLIDSFSYGYDANKNVTGETRGGVMSGFSWNTDNSGASGYDDDDRLVYWKHADSSQTQSWNLSLVGDWNSTTINGTQQNRTHNSVHELTAVDSSPLTYDVKGNVTTNTNGHTYSWDFDNRMTGANTDGNPGDEVTFEYDALGRRVRKNNGTTNTVFVLAGWQVVAEYGSGTAAASPSEQYVYASYIDEPILKTGTGGSVYYSRNRQYSITCLTNSTGAPIEYYAYDSHGKLAIFDASGSPISATQYANLYTYTGRRYEVETDLYYFRARYFDAALGRFIGRDPLEYVEGMSLYRAYFVPKQTDPNGMWSWAINEGKCLVTMTYKIETNFKDNGTDVWTQARKDRFKQRLKSQIENAFNNSPFVIKPKAPSCCTTREFESYYPDQNYSPEVPVTHSHTTTHKCPCPLGFGPAIQILFVPENQKTWGEDWQIRVTANSAGDFMRSSANGWYGYLDENDVVMLHGQFPGVHEFGHSIGLDHPGSGIWGADEYDHKGFDYWHRRVDGSIDLMGGGMGMRPFYFDLWKDEVKSKYNSCCEYKVL